MLEEVNANTKSLLALDALLLERLTANSGNLLDDEDLIDVLANTKMKAAEVKEKLVAAGETRHNINEKRELFRPVATRGSVLYFSVVEMSMVNVMYQTSLAQVCVSARLCVHCCVWRGIFFLACWLLLCETRGFNLRVCCPGPPLSSSRSCS